METQTVSPKKAGEKYFMISLPLRTANAFSVIKTLVGDAALVAIMEAKTKGLSLTYLRKNGKLVKTSPDGRETIIEPIIKKDDFYVSYKPSTILNATNK